MKSISEHINDIYFKVLNECTEIAIKRIESLARNILVDNKQTNEFIMAMGSFFFTSKLGDVIYDKEDLRGYKKLEDFIYSLPKDLCITGEPMRFTKNGPVITDW